MHQLFRRIRSAIVFLFFIFLYGACLGFSESKKQVVVIVNPISGDVDKREILQEIFRRLDNRKFDIEVLFTNAPQHAIKLTKDALRGKADIVVAVGGDGSINEIGQSLVNSKAVLALIPTGSGNGLARHLGIPLDTSKAIDVINQGHVKTIDSVRINNRYYFGIAGIGFDAQISWDFAEYGKRGFLSYLMLSLKQFPHYQPLKYDLLLDGKRVSREAFLITFANSSEFGNGAVIAPKAEIDDGFLDVVVLKNFPMIASPKIAWRLFHHSMNNSRYVENFRCKVIQIDQPNLKVHIDGEPVLFPEGIHLEVVPASLKVLIPN